jgi:hypothetical protein
MKKRNTILLPISGDDADRNVRVTLTQEDKGYYQGELSILGTPYHVEAIQMDKKSLDINPPQDSAVNGTYQNRIDRYAESNDGLVPKTVTVGRRVFFVVIEAYAQ